jgi:hypothetical protein
MLLFEGTLTLDGQAIPARLELAIDRRELATLLASLTENGEVGPQRREWRGDISSSQLASGAPIVANGDSSGAIVKRAGPAGGFEPIEIREHPGRRIKFEHLAYISDPAKIWAALAERFPWAGFKVPAGGELTAGDLAGDGDTAINGDTISQLDSDWLTIEPHLDDLVTDEGRPVRGYQSRIAEYLGGTNDGHFRRERVMPLVERLRVWIDEEWILSSSSTQDEETDEAGESGESTRVA